MLALLALAGGVIAGYWLLELVKHSLPEGIPRADRVALDSRVLFAAALAGLVATLVAGLIPAWQASRTSLADMAREGTSGTPPRGRRVWQHAFLVTQVAVVTVLLTATTLLVGSFVRVLAVDLGFEHRNLIGVRASPPLPEDEKQSEALLRDFNGRALDTLRSVPGVVSVAGLSRSRLPLFGASTSTRITAPGSTAPAAPVDMHLVTPGYFETARIAIVHGRVFSDAERGQRVAIIDALAATQLFGTTDVSGRSVTLPSAGDVHIVGVTTSVRSQGPEGPVNGQLFMPVDDVAAIQMFVVRTSTPAADVAPALEAALAPLLPAGSGKPSISMTGEQYRTMTADRRFNAGLMFALGVMAMVIGVGGIYASTTTLVAQRTREIGIRMALGASASGVVRAITGATTRLLLIGTVIGVGAGWAASGFMQSVIFGITATDLMTYVIPSVIVLAGGVLAALLPARRAARIDPLVTLRTE